MTIENRSAQRHLSLGTTEYSKFSVFQNQPQFQTGNTVNISSGGLSFTSKENFKTDDLLLVNIHLRGWESEKKEFIKPQKTSQFEPLKALLKVKWQEIKTTGEFQIGGEFISIDADHQKALHRFLDKMN